jgi:hypothetical protein
VHHCSATVRIKGDLLFTVHKPSLTIAEIVLLRAIHGQEAVVDVVLVGKSKRTLRADRDRLLRQYGSAQAIEKVIGVMFQNVSVQPLETMEDIGLSSSARVNRVAKDAAMATAAVALEQEDFEPYDPAEDDIQPGGAGGDDEDGIAPVPEVAMLEDDPEPTPEEVAALMSAGATTALARRRQKAS